MLLPIPASPGKQVLIASSRENLDATSTFLHRAMFAAFGVAVLWSTALVIWMVRRQTATHENIASVARRVASGDLDARVTAHSDDVEEAQLGQDIDHMIAQLGGLVTSQKRFTANAAHELRSPIAVVCGELQQTLRKPRDAEGYRAGAERALRGAERLRALAEDLLTLVRPTRDEEVVESELNRLIGGAVGPLEGLAAERGVRVLVGSASSALKVRGHARDLERMFRNLVENGVRHANGTVELSTRTAAQRLEVTIQDDGAGVADSDRERIFEPFYRAPQARASALGGSGLGLAIAREIARAHDGDVTLAATLAPAGGACFVVSLPTA
jgi:two-component system, OmpR family, sensor kinase